MTMTPDERREIIEAFTVAMTASIGPASDMQRSIMAARVDGLIDARKRFIGAGWPEWLIQIVLVTMVTGKSPMISPPSQSEE